MKFHTSIYRKFTFKSVLASYKIVLLMHYKCSLNGTLLDREFKSIIVNEAIRTISSLFIFYFLRNNFERKKAPKHKINNFPPLRGFSARKIVAFIDSCSLVFVLLVDFCLICVFVRLNLFVKRINKLKIVLIASFAISRIYLHTLMFMTICRIFLHKHLSKSFLTCTHPFPLVFFIFQNLFSSVRICMNAKTSKVLILFVENTVT